MTSDAKVGLLLGLVFIFIIAFIINGLPNFHADRDNSELTTSMVGSDNNSLGLAARERNARDWVVSRIEPVVRKQHPQVAVSSTHNQNIRFETALPRNSSVANSTTVTNSTSTPTNISVVSAAKKMQGRKSKQSRPLLSGVYIVKEGDNLAVVAKKFYGSEQGNKKANIAGIFQANHSILKSPDKICPGQKLIIPTLSSSVSIKSETAGVLVKFAGRKHSGRTKRNVYVVRDGDSLWNIAAEQLGNGSRYGELVELNADIIDDEDNLAVGMRLKLPAK